MNKFDSKSGIGEALKLYGAKVYTIKPNPKNEFVDEKYQCLAKRMTLNLSQDAVYKTQFHNPLLAYALKPLNKDTALIFYDEHQKEIKPYPVPELNLDYASIVYDVEPSEIPATVSIVIYTGPEVADVLLADGSVQMIENYNPVYPQDIATKNYIDKTAENFTALSYPLKDFNIVQEDLAPVKGICHLNNQLFDTVLFLKDQTTSKNLADCKLTIDSFAIPNNFSENIQIGICANGTTSHSAFIKDIIEGNGGNWQLVDSDNVYSSDIPKVFWKNSFTVTFNLGAFSNRISKDKPFIDFKIKIWDEAGNTKYSLTKTYGIDNYINPVQVDANVSYIPENLEKFKTKYISGNKFFPDIEDKVYELPIRLQLTNTFLRYYRAEVPIKLSVISNDNSTFKEYKLLPKLHQPLTGNLNFDQIIEFTTAFKCLKLECFNLSKEVVFETELNLDISRNTGSEDNRVTTPNADTVYPSTDYGELWDSTRPLEDFEMKLLDDTYVSTNSKSAVCLVFNPTDCYSHVKIDAETDGHMYILSEGNTKWLDCEKLATAFDTPINNGQGCKLNEKFYTFGKVNYKSRIFIRVLGATSFKLKSVELG